MKTRIVLAVCVLLACGCVPTTEDVMELGNNVDRLMVKVDSYQATVKEKMAAYSEKMSSEIDDVQEKVVIINDAVKASGGDILDKIGAGVEASKPFNPYADEMTAVLALAGLIMGKRLYSGGKEKKKLTSENTGLKNGIARAEGMATPEVAGNIHDAVKVEVLKANGN